MTDVPAAASEGSTCARQTDLPRFGDMRLDVILPMILAVSPSTIWEASVGTIAGSSVWRPTRIGRSLRS